MIFKRTRSAHVSCEFFNKFAGLRPSPLHVILIELCVCSAPRPLSASPDGYMGSPQRRQGTMRARGWWSMNRNRRP
jgi:hypothetical protein